jgi:serine/threonine protein kinase
MVPETGVMVTPVVRLSRQLGAGGMGSIWLADHLSLHAPVVVKFMTAELLANADAVRRFQREAMAAAQLRSPHVVQVFDHGVSDGIPYIVMELLDGRDLGALIEERHRLTPAELEGIVAQVCKALAKAHGKGIIHRDIKPQNIFLCTTDGDETFVKLLDFGIAKTDAQSASGVATRTGAILGTPLYMSPEQIAGGKTVDARADIWAMGVVVFEALTGTKPFLADDFGALVLLLHTGQTPRLTALVPTLPPAIDEWFARACHRDVAQRFATIAEMLGALRTALGLRSGSGPAVGLSPSAPEAGRAGALPTVTAPMGPRPSPVGSQTQLHPITNSGLAATANGVPLEKSRGLWLALGSIIFVAVAGAAYALHGSSLTKAPPELAASLVAPPPPTDLASALPAPTPSTVSAPSSEPAKQAATGSPTAPNRPNATAGGHTTNLQGTAGAQAGHAAAFASAIAPTSSAVRGNDADAGKGRPRFKDIE